MTNSVPRLAAALASRGVSLVYARDGREAQLALHTPCAVTGRCDNDACRGPERQCGKILIIENEKIADRMTVLLVGGSSFGY